MVALLMPTKLTPISVWMMMYFYKLMQVFGTPDAG
jgi:hypothetical protein